jgi:hypothetical protein
VTSCRGIRVGGMVVAFGPPRDVTLSTVRNDMYVKTPRAPTPKRGAKGPQFFNYIAPRAPTLLLNIHYLSLRT